MTYRLDVVASSIADVVSGAGGWVFDRVMAGWNVTAVVTDEADNRPLQILGAEWLDLEAALAGAADRPHPQTLAVAAELLHRDPRVRQRVLDALGAGHTQVTLWGEDWPADLDGGIGGDVVAHRLSSAARMFKAQALAAAAVADASVGSTELFRTGSAPAALASDLTPTG